MATSTHPGGAAGNSGGEHEALRSLRAMLRVRNGKAANFRFEEPGVDGAEFYLQCASVREYWQAKRQITGQDAWPLHRFAVQPPGAILSNVEAAEMLLEQAVPPLTEVNRSLPISVATTCGRAP